MPKGDKAILKADPEDGTTPVSNLLLEALAYSRLSGLERGALVYLWRRTYGWTIGKKRRKERVIPLSEWEKALHTDKIIAWKILNSLEKKCVIKLKRLGKGKSISYMTNTHIYEWTCIDKELFAKWLTPISQTNNTSISETANTVLAKSTIPLDTTLAMPKESDKQIIKETIINKTIKGKEKVSFSLPTWVNEDTWNDFLEMRQKMKAEPTEKAKVLLVKELEKLKSKGDEPDQVLGQSIMNNWKGLFALKEHSAGGNYHGTNAAYKAQGQTSEPIKFIDGDAPAPVE